MASGAAHGGKGGWMQEELGNIQLTNRKRSKLGPGRPEDCVYAHYNVRCALKSREPEQFAS